MVLLRCIASVEEWWMVRKRLGKLYVNVSSEFSQSVVLLIDMSRSVEKET